MLLTFDNLVFAYFLVRVSSTWGPFFITLVRRENKGHEKEGRKTSSFQ